MDSIYRLLETMGYTHPIHPAITHLAIGLVIAALIFYLVSLLMRHEKYAQTAKHCSTLAFLAIFPTVISGLMDWSYYYGANWTLPIKMKIILACALALVLVLSIFLNNKTYRRSWAMLPVYLIAFFTVVGLGYFGGEIVYGKKTIKGNEKGGGIEKAVSESSKSPSVLFADVQKILENNCTKCHSGNNPSKDLNLSTYQGVMQGGQNGAVVVPGKPEESELLIRVKGLSKPQMPPAGPGLSDSDIRTLEKWIHIEAPGPEN